MAITFYLILFFAAGNDLIAIKLGLSINQITRTFQVLIVLLPPLAYWVTKRICMSLQRRDHDLVLHGRETGRIVRTGEGNTFEVHEPLPEYERWTLVQHEVPTPVRLAATVDANGVRRVRTRREAVRARISNFYFAQGIQPVTPAELTAAHHDGAAREAIETGNGRARQEIGTSEAYAGREDGGPDPTTSER
jgi:ubiquinol-cytochrome c reductase cytochrome b subunit